MVPFSYFSKGTSLLFLAASSLIKADERKPRLETGSRASYCEARTINYITHTLPRLCLRNTWTSPTSTLSIVQTTEYPSIDDEKTKDRASLATSVNDNEPQNISNDTFATPFMSFEDWKELVLREAGQDPQEIKLRKLSSKHHNERSSPDAGDIGLGEEGEISLTFDGYSDEDGAPAYNRFDVEAKEVILESSSETMPLMDSKSMVHRSKDAGKTCKERFSYSSFDAGATVLKSAHQAKNAKAILVENKDSYMLLECMAQNKYVIVELSDDILIDTVVIANFEFFSSMIRHFRISVSDRYPVKTEKWRDLGTFEARNSRDIQPFLVDNPQIWAKYVRIEFLTHYGNEFYCPVSLLRIHGTRMLDSWKEIETSRDEEIHGDGEEDFRQLMDDGVKPTALSLESQDAGWNSSSFANVSQLWPDPFGHDLLEQFAATCAISFDPLSSPMVPNSRLNQVAEGTTQTQSAPDEWAYNGNSNSNSDDAPDSRSRRDDSGQPHERSTNTSLRSQSELKTSTQAGKGDGLSSFANMTNTGAGIVVTANDANSTQTKASTIVASGGKSRSTWTTGPLAASPTIQEGFFNSITKRLQQVETNLTLSLKYVEEQSRHMQDILQRAEQKQLSKLSDFLGSLNQSLFIELLNIRDQYDQIWQSTVLALESQREQSDRDIVALSTRLNLLADEVVFQKRMAIVQAVLLLSCLFLVIFSRGVSLPYITPLPEHGGVLTFQESEKSCKLSDPGKSENISSSLGDIDRIHYGDGFQAQSFMLPLPRSNNRRGEEYGRLSPPNTPNPNDINRFSSANILSRDSQSNSSRRPHVGSHHASRKPLPSLPEDMVTNEST